MQALVLALSISDKIEQFGSYAGYASVLGLGVLSMLYFSQAREVRRLRDWAGRAPERAAELEAQAVEAAERARTTPAQPAATPVTPAGVSGAPTSPAKPVPAVNSAASPATAAAATAAATAATAPATAATAVTPPAAAGPVKPAPTGDPKPAGAPSEAPASNAAPATAAKPGLAAPPAAPVATPATAASSPAPAPASSSSTPEPEPPLPKTSILETASPTPAARPGPTPPEEGQASTAAGARGPVPDRPRRTVELRSGTTQSATVPPGRSSDAPRRSRLRTLLPIGGALAVIAVLVVVLTGGDDSPTKTTPNRVVNPGSTTTSTTSQPTKADTLISVLNGTTVNGLAGQISAQLEANGYKVTKTTNAVDQSQTNSHVAYADNYKAAAQTVARIVGIDTGEVLPMDPDTKLQAGDKARVVVVVGADTASKAQ